MKINLKKIPNKQRAVPTYHTKKQTIAKKEKKRKKKTKDKKHKCTHKN
jgi:hypothetical protein